MNKQLIITYFEEFKHWLNGGKLLAKNSNKGWIDYYGEDIWTHSTETLIVIDDEYSMFRKALIEGESIEVLQSNTERWVNIGTIIESIKPELYRIKPNKPEEPKFKVGDWVRVKTATFEYDGTATILKGVKKLSKSDMWLFSENHYKCDPDKYIEFWKPKEEEYFWYKNDLVKFDEIKTNCGTLLNSVRGCSYHTAEENFEDYCEPFIGQLPTNIKD